MSRKVQAKHSITVANNKLGGARITRSQRRAICIEFVDWAFSNGFVFNTLRDVTVEAVMAFIGAQKAAGVSNATLHNRLASVRRSMLALGAHPDEIGITAQEIGLAPRKREGTKVPIPDDVYEGILERAYQIGEVGFAIAIKLERLLGLRGLEALMCIPDLERFALEAAEIVSIQDVSITRGTKGGRLRTTQVIAARARETLLTIREALSFARQNGGHLICGAIPGLKSARAKYHRVAAKVGLVGKCAPHSLRYAYAVELLLEMRDAGLNKKEALALLSKFLGHGAGRGRHITMVYGKTVVHTLKDERRKSRIGRAITSIESLVYGGGQSNSALPDR